MLPVAVLASGRGTNLQALIDHAADPTNGYRIACVIGDRVHAGALDRARAAAIPAHFIDRADFDSRSAFDDAIDRQLAEHGVRFIALAGFMRVLGSAFVQKWVGSMVNIHPSLLPKYRGLDTHARALAAGDTTHGASVHYVTETLDGGPVILQAVVRVEAGSTPETLARSVQEQEHRIYPFVVSLIALGRVALEEGRVVLDGRSLQEPICIDATSDVGAVLRTATG